MLGLSGADHDHRRCEREDERPDKPLVSFHDLLLSLGSPGAID
jgi:hypothetical protein